MHSCKLSLGHFPMHQQELDTTCTTNPSEIRRVCRAIVGFQSNYDTFLYHDVAALFLLKKIQSDLLVLAVLDIM